MHFWIDKRSPQCGFGRSRVAASLHTGGSGLSFGHPPRRSGGHKSSSSSSTSAVNSSLLASSNTGIQVHRQHSHHQSQQQQQASAAQYHTHAATTSNNAQYRSANYSSSNTTSSNNNNSNNALNHGTNRNVNRPNVITSHHYYNNNRQQQSANCILPNSSNNNYSNLAGTTQNLISPTGNNLNTSSLNNATTANTTAAAAINTTGAHHQHAQRYRHPQFGNMSVRTYQPSLQQHQQAAPTTTISSSTTHLQQHQTQIHSTPITTDNFQNNLMATTTNAAAAAAATTTQLQQSLDASLNTLNEHGIHQSPNQTANLTAELYQQQTSPRIASNYNRTITSATMSPAICDYNNGNLRTTYTNSTLTSSITTTNQHHPHQQQQHSRQRRTARSVENTDLQFLPLHLKCGIFASLVLAIAFIVGIKVYFDNHGTKFEVGLFWLLTATFVFAFCFVSICKVPRVLFASTTSSRSNSRDQTRDRCSMDDVGGQGSMVNSIEEAVITGMHEFQQEQIQSININAQAGPPPYHIAILLPETKAKEEINTLEESPPPSYDKILI